VPKLLEWFAQNARDLPWRRTDDPYCVFVSEIMLQQTQVKTVVPYWERWMRSLPDVGALAKAAPARLHKLWEGLGYYTRVRNMHRAAQLIVDAHGGSFPSRYEDILALPGIGRYTAGAIASIAFNQPKPVLDGNVIRVLTRLFGIDRNPREPRINAHLWCLAEELVTEASTLQPSATGDSAVARLTSRAGPPKASPAAVTPPSPHPVSALNQSLMELGALVCTPRQPRCVDCPVQGLCRARRENRVEQLPGLGVRARPTARRVAAFVLQDGQRFLVRQRPAGVVNAHLWEFPNLDALPDDADLRKTARRALGFSPRSLTHLCTIRHSITRYRITLDAFRVALRSGGKRPAAPGRWLPLTALRRLPFASAHKRILDQLDGV